MPEAVGARRLLLALLAERFGVTAEQILGHCRDRPIARARQAGYWLARQRGASLPEIAMRFGGRHHATILHGIRLIDDLRAKDPELRVWLDAAKQTLTH